MSLWIVSTHTTKRGLALTMTQSFSWGWKDALIDHLREQGDLTSTQKNYILDVPGEYSLGKLALHAQALEIEIIVDYHGKL